MSFQNLYFLAIVPPADISKEIVGIQQDLSDRFKTQKSLKVMPHITIKAPFKYRSDNHTDVLNWFEKLKITSHPFLIELKDFGCFRNSDKPVIYIKPVNNALLIALQRSVIGQFMEKFPAVPVLHLEIHYNPHLTVAYRDLGQEYFASAWAEYSEKQYGASFNVNTVFLFQHDGKRWNEIGSRDLI